MAVLRGRVFWRVAETLYLTPTFDPEAPDTLLRIEEKRKVRGRSLAAMGYEIDRGERDSDFWFRRVWTTEAEEWSVPVKVSAAGDADDADDVKWTIDAVRTVTHGMGFVPAVWVRNLPSCDEVDGEATFRPAIETQIEIEYLLSQGGRGLKYQSDPLLLIREPAAPEGGDIIRSAGNALIVSEKGDAKLLEIGGSATAAVLDHVARLREAALETLHGNRSNPEKLSAAQSGRALEMLHGPLIALADRLRISYGEDALLRLARMFVAAAGKVPVFVDGKPAAVSHQPLSLKWGPWFLPTHQDLLQQAQTLAAHRTAGHMSQETAVGAIAAAYDVEDPAAEMSRIGTDQDASDARAAKAAAAKPTPTKPAGNA
jgi:hypothetical protein